MFSIFFEHVPRKHKLNFSGEHLKIFCGKRKVEKLFMRLNLYVDLGLSLQVRTFYRNDKRSRIFYLHNWMWLFPSYLVVSLSHDASKKKANMCKKYTQKNLIFSLFFLSLASSNFSTALEISKPVKKKTFHDVTGKRRNRFHFWICFVSRELVKPSESLSFPIWMFWSVKQRYWIIDWWRNVRKNWKKR